MSSDLQRQHERARANFLLRGLGVTASFLRPGDDRGEPDMLYTLSNGKTLGVEVATAYYSDEEARADWTLARGDRPSPPRGVETRPQMYWHEDDLCARLRSELLDKCDKRYGGADHVWLCLHAHAALSDRASVSKCVRHLRRLIPPTHGFEAIYLTYTGSIHEDEKARIFVLFRRALGAMCKGG
jgi:hypothetical protein